jgi:hypothetical protein
MKNCSTVGNPAQPANRLAVGFFRKHDVRK